MQERLMWLVDNGYTHNGIIQNTKTTRFLMPLIGITEYGLNHIHPELLINAHIKSKEEILIYVIINKLDLPEESKDYVLLQNLNEHFVDYIEEEQEYILIYKLPDHFLKDYNKILKGEYSKTSDSYKQILIRVHGVQNHTESHLATVHDCLYPTDIKRKQLADHFLVNLDFIEEVCSKPRPNYEIFKTIKQLKEEYGK